MLINGHICGLSAAGLSALALAAALSIPMQSMAGPEGGVISAGSGSIAQPNAATTNVLQNTHRMAVDWQSFNLTAQETVNFNQPSASAAVLNRIHDQNPSQIFGAINANGRVFLANPNGIVFGQTATVNVGALIAAGMNISNNDFMAGNYSFTAGENGAGVVVNRGLINAATGGSVGLLGSTVINEGIIVADYGNIELASGNRAVVNFDGDGLLNIQVSEDVLNNAVENDAAISNKGTLLADGGQVVLTAHAASDVFDNAINNEGIIKAARIDNTGGVIRLVGNSGTVLHSGEISAQGENGSGGTVHVLGDRVGLIDDASIDVSGDSGGGTVLVGGDWQGKGELQTASRTYVGEKALIKADAKQSGDGGKVVVWADENTRYYGSITSRGGSTNGNGGAVEVSGKQALDFQGEVDLTAVNGTGGTLLLDPDDIYLDTNCTAAPCLGAVDGTNDIPILFDDFQVQNVFINVGAVTGESLLQLEANNDIFVQADLIMDAGNNVFFHARNDINVNAAITTSTSGNSDGDITLTADNTLAINANITTENGLLNLSGGSEVRQSLTSTVNAGNGSILMKAANGNIDLQGTLASNNEVRIVNANNATLGNISAASGSVILGNSLGPLSGAIAQNNGTAINASNLSINSGATVTLNQSNNIVNLGEVIRGGAFSLSDNGGLDVSSDITGGINTANAVTLNTTGVLDLNGNISGNQVNLTGTGVTQDAASSIDAGAGQIRIDANDGTINISGNLTTDGAASAVRLVNATSATLGGTISALNGGTVVLGETGGDNLSGNVIQNSGTIGAANLVINSDGAITLNSNNAIDTLGNVTRGGDFVLNDDGGLIVNGDVNGGTTTNIVSLISSGGTLEVNGNISGSQVNLTAGNITGDGSGVITAGQLNTTSDTGTELTAVDHAVEAYFASNSGVGEIIFNNASPGMLDITGITQNGTDQVTITETGNINITQAINASNSTLDLNAGGTISQSGVSSSIAAASLDTRSSGGTTLTQSITTAAFSAIDTGGGNIELTNASGGILGLGAIMTNGGLRITESNAIDVGGVINAGGTVTLNANGGAINQSAGSITAALLDTSSNGGILLNRTNAVGAFTANNDTLGNIELNNASGGTLNITDTGISQSGGGNVLISETGSLSVVAGTAGIAGINAAGSTIELIADTMVLNASLTGDAVMLRPLTDSLPISLGAGSGLVLDITNVAAKTLILGANSHTGGINVNTETAFGDSNSRLELRTSGAGSVNGISALSVSVDNTGTLVVSAGSGIDLGGGNNAATVSLNNSAGAINYNSIAGATVNASAINGGGAITLTTANALTTNGSISTTGGAGTINLTASSGALSLGHDISTTGTVNLNSNGVINQTGGVITASLLDTNSTGGTILNQTNNAVGAFTANNDTSGNIELTNTSGSTLNIIDTGISQSGGGDVVITESGSLRVDAGISNSGGNVTLDAGGAITQTGAIITMGTLDTTSVGGITLTGSNTVANFTADNINGGGVVLTNASGGTLNVTDVTNTGGGKVTISESGMLSIDGIVSNADSQIELFANNMDIATNGSVESGLGLVTLSAIDSTRKIHIGVASTAETDPFLGITNTMLNKITTTGGVTIGSTAHTAGITIVGDTDLTTSTINDGKFSLISGGIVSVDAELRNKVNTELQSTLNDISFGNGAVVESTEGSIEIDSGANIRGSGPLQLIAKNDLDINKSMVIEGNTFISAGTLILQQDITTTGSGTLELKSTGTITLNPDITLTAADALTLSAARGTGNLALAGLVINLMDLTVDGTASLRARAGVNADDGNLTINGTVTTTGDRDIVITASDLDLNGSLDSAGALTRISDNGNGIGLGDNQRDSLNIDISEFERISGAGIVLSTTGDLKIEGTFNSKSTVPLTIDAGTVTLPQATSIIHGASLDLTNSEVNASSSLNLDITGSFAMNGTIDAASTVVVNATQGVTMGEPSSIKTSNDQVDITTAGGDVRLGLIDVGNASVNVTASAGSILNNNGVFTDITQSNDNVRSANVTLDAIDRIGVSSTDAITLNINSGGLITLDFGAPKAFINNKQNTKIVNLGSGEVAIGFIFSSEIIGIGHYVGVNNERNPPGSDTDAEAAKQSEMISVLGADYRAVPLGEEEGEEIISTLSPTVPVLIRTTQGWEFKAPSRSRRPGDTGEQPGQRKDIRYIDW